MDISGSFVFSIKDKKLNFKDIEDNLHIEPTKIIKNGQMVGKLKNYEAPYDIWSFEINIIDYKNIFNDLLNLLELLNPYSEYIKEISFDNKNVTIDCYLRSNYGQIGFQMNNKIFKKLVDLGLSLNFHILSYGEATD
ncbi:DUF4279 domain-containing protein [Mycoplasmatota bacterium]|nr:DUF4279 domain-containing protein [Mycoplasmatota bacterium]